MRYFTPAWHSDGDATRHPGKEYKAHVAALLPQMPPDVRTLATRVNIHDGLLWRMAADEARGALSLTLRCGDLQRGYFDLGLEYAGVCFSPALSEGLSGLAGQPTDRDLQYIPRRSEALYDEVAREGEAWVHRILFISRGDYLELTVHFKGLQVRISPASGRYDIDRTGAA